MGPAPEESGAEMVALTGHAQRAHVGGPNPDWGDQGALPGRSHIQVETAGRRSGPDAEGEEARERWAQGTGGESGARPRGRGSQCGQSILQARAAQGDETELCPEGGRSFLPGLRLHSGGHAVPIALREQG